MIQYDRVRDIAKGFTADPQEIRLPRRNRRTIIPPPKPTPPLNLSNALTKVPQTPLGGPVGVPTPYGRAVPARPRRQPPAAAPVYQPNVPPDKKWFVNGSGAAPPAQPQATPTRSGWSTLWPLKPREGQTVDTGPSVDMRGADYPTDWHPGLIGYELGWMGGDGARTPPTQSQPERPVIQFSSATPPDQPPPRSPVPRVVREATTLLGQSADSLARRTFSVPYRKPISSPAVPNFQPRNGTGNPAQSMPMPSFTQAVGGYASTRQASREGSTDIPWK